MATCNGAYATFDEKERGSLEVDPDMLKDIHEYKMNKTLLTQALIKFLAGIILTGLLVFLPAGSLTYWQGWLLIGILFVPMFIAGIFILVKSPELLRKRLNAKENESEQKTVVALSGLLFIISFVTAGLNWRFNWWMLEIQEGQKVIDTGLYGIVRHPMYMATVLMFLSMPLVLSSPISFIIMFGYIPVIAKRIRNEEEVLEDGLIGYKEYKTRVKYKVIPFIW